MGYATQHTDLNQPKLQHVSAISRISQELVKNPLVVLIVFESHWLGGVLALALVVVLIPVSVLASPLRETNRQLEALRCTYLYKREDLMGEIDSYHKIICTFDLDGKRYRLLLRYHQAEIINPL